MTDSGHGEPVLRYDVRPTRRSSGGRRWLSFGALYRCCALLGVLFLALLVFAIFMLARSMLRFVLFQHHDIVLTSKQRNGTLISVLPLINSTHTFDVHATVWLDVSEHLEEGKPLPELPSGPIELLQYETLPGKRRTDAVLFSGLVFRNVAWKEAQFTEQAIKLPIEPLYSQQIGPSSLRISYQLIVSPRKEQLGTLQSLTSIFPDSSAILPRSPMSRRIKPSSNATVSVEDNSRALKIRTSSIDEALENLGVSDSLLTLRSSSYRAAECPLPNLLEPFNCSTFIDNAYDRQKFVSHTIKDQKDRRLILDQNCTIWTPHINTRSSIFFVPMERELVIGNYFNRQDTLAAELAECFELGKAPSTSIKCKQLRKNGPLEGMLTFKKERNHPQKDNRIFDMIYRYAPQIVNRADATSPIDLLAVPRDQPTARSTSEKYDECQLPSLRVDESGSFFDVTIEIRFGFLPLFQAMHIDAASLANQENKTTELIDDNDDRDFLSRTTLDEIQLWNAASMLLGDQKNPRTRTRWQIADFLFAMGSNAVITILTLLYWYTRTGTQGLSLIAMKIAMFGEFFDVAFNANKIRLGRGGFTNFFYIADTGAIFFFRLLLLLRIDVIHPSSNQSFLHYRITRRPRNKQERVSEQLDKRFGVLLPVVFAVGYVVLEHFLSRGQYVFKSGQGCRTTQEPDKHSLEDLSFVGHIFLAAFIVQLVFNAYSHAPRQRGTSSSRRRTGSYAGSFKSTCWLTFVMTAMRLFSAEEHLGHTGSRSPLLYQHLTIMTVTTAAFVQTLLYPSVPKHTEEVDNEDDK